MLLEVLADGAAVVAVLFLARRSAIDNSRLQSSRTRREQLQTTLSP
jgi:hypothetical protein